MRAWLQGRRDTIGNFLGLWAQHETLSGVTNGLGKCLRDDTIAKLMHSTHPMTLTQAIAKLNDPACVPT
jgi:hypothetical protein